MTIRNTLKLPFHLQTLKFKAIFMVRTVPPEVHMQPTEPKIAKDSSVPRWT